MELTRQQTPPLLVGPPNPPHLPPPTSLIHPSAPNNLTPIPPTQHQHLEFRLAHLMARLLSGPFQIDSHLVDAITSLDLDNNDFSQLVTMCCVLYLKQQLLKSRTLKGIEDGMERGFRRVAVESEPYWEGLNEVELLEQNQRIYTIKYTDKVYDAFEGKGIFNNYMHLFVTLKQFTKHVKKAIKAIQQILKKTIDQQTPFKTCVTQKIDTKNLELSIDQLIVSDFPQLLTTKPSLFETIQQRLSSLSNYGPAQLIKLLKDILRERVEERLQHCRKKKEFLQCTVDNWIEVELYFANQKKIVNVIKLIEEECTDNEYEIVKVQGSFQSKRQGSGISMKIKIDNVCCKFNFFYETRQREVYLHQFVRKAKRSGLGYCLFSLMEINRAYKENLLERLQKGIGDLSKDYDVSMLRTSLDELNINEYQDLSESSNLKNSSITQQYDGRDSQKSRTEVIGLENQSTARSKYIDQLVLSERRSRKRSQDQSQFTAERAISKLRLEKQESKKVKFRFLTQVNETLQEPTSLSSILPKFEEDIFENSGLSLKQSRSCLTRQINITVVGFKQTKPEQSSQTTQGQCEINLLRQKINQLEENCKILEAQNLNKESTIEVQRQSRYQCEKKYEMKAHESQCYLQELQHLRISERELQNHRQRLTEDIRQLRAEKAERIATLNGQVKLLQRGQLSYKDQIKHLIVSEQQSKDALKQNYKALETVNREVQQLKQKVQKLEKDPPFANNSTKNYRSQLHLHGPNTISSSATGSQATTLHQSEIGDLSRHQPEKQSSKEGSTPHSKRQKDKAGDQSRLNRTEKHQSGNGKIADDKERGSCERCESQRDRTWQIRKKLYYTTIIFIILIFEAVTFSFSARLLQ